MSLDPRQDFVTTRPAFKHDEHGARPVALPNEVPATGVSARPARKRCERRQLVFTKIDEPGQLGDEWVGHVKRLLDLLKANNSGLLLSIVKINGGIASGSAVSGLHRRASRQASTAESALALACVESDVMLSNDNYPEGADARRPVVDPHGHAALLLVESLIHVLREKDVLTPAGSLEVVSTALAVQEDHASESDASAPEMWRAHALLAGIAASLKMER